MIVVDLSKAFVLNCEMVLSVTVVIATEGIRTDSVKLLRNRLIKERMVLRVLRDLMRSDIRNTR